METMKKVDRRGTKENQNSGLDTTRGKIINLTTRYALRSIWVFSVEPPLGFKKN